jgi:signal transduction histidine kinase
MILQNYVRNFPAYLSIHLVDNNGAIEASSEIESSHTTNYAKNPLFTSMIQDQKLQFSKLKFNESLMPILEVAVPISHLNKLKGALIGSLNIIHLWNIVESIKAGKEGYCLLLDHDHRLIAHGDARGKSLVLEYQEKYHAKPRQNYWNEEVLQATANIPLTQWTAVIEQPKSETFSKARQIVIYVVVSCIFLLLASALVAYYGGRRIVQAVTKLVDGTKHFASGELNYQVHITGNDEFATLANSFNRMGEDLQRFQKELALKERLATFGKVAAALAHDLKHPIHNLTLNGKLLQERHQDAEFRKHFFDVLHREIGSLNYLVSQLQDLSHKRDLIKISMNIFTEIKQVIGSMPDEIQRLGVTIKILEPEEEIFVLADMMAVRRLISNITRNALEAFDELNNASTPPTITIQGAVNLEHTMAQIRFSDNAKGIPPERLKTIFEEFRSTKSNSQKANPERIGGLGLGMPIIKQICEEHGGSIDIESTVGKGTTLIVNLPLAKGATAKLFSNSTDY